VPKRKVRETKPTRTFRKPRYTPTRKVCAFCAGKVAAIDYKDVEKLRGFISDRAKISPRRRTGTCAKHQRVLAVAIKRARHLALLPYVPAHMRRVAGIVAG
jgi:small subunit ribosomal protein S18